MTEENPPKKTLHTEPLTVFVPGVEGTRRLTSRRGDDVGLQGRVVPSHDDDEAKGSAFPGVVTGSPKEDHPPETTQALVAERATIPGAVAMSPMKQEGSEAQMHGADETRNLDLPEDMETGHDQAKRLSKEMDGSNAFSSIVTSGSSKYSSEPFEEDRSQMEGERVPMEPEAHPSEPEDTEATQPPIAHAVEGEEYDPNKPIAERYDPNAKKPFYQRRKFRLVAVLASVTLILIAVGVTVGVVVGKKDGPSGPTLAPTTTRELEIRNRISQEVSNDVSDPESSPGLAAEWIISEDPLAIPSDAPNLIQRYVLALFYYVTTNNRETMWRTCNPPEVEEGDQCRFQPMNRDGEVEDRDGIRWLSGAAECDWAGVRCDLEARVESLYITAHNLTGTVPSELATLSHLSSLELYFNELTGVVPWSYFGQLQDLWWFDLSNNQLSGAIPDSFWDQATALAYFNIGDNSMTGTIGPSLGRLTDLENLYLFENSFSGSIPSQIGQMASLEFVWLWQNNFIGTIPTELGNLSLLKDLRWQLNAFSGPIPSEMGRLSQLDYLTLWENSLSGNLPEEFYNMTALTTVYLTDQHLNGTLSSNIQKLTSLKKFWVRINRFTGSVPSEMAQITTLSELVLDTNLFSGSIPEELCANVDLLGLLISADCAPEDDPAHACDCCAACYDRDTGVISQ